MGADLLDDLNKQSISELSSSYLWPSAAFWVGNILMYSLINKISLDISFLNSLSGEIITGIISISAGVIVFNAWLVRLIVPFFYRILQGVNFNFGLFRNEQVRRYLRLKKDGYELAVEHEIWENRQIILLDPPVNPENLNPTIEFKTYRADLLKFVEQKITTDLLARDGFYLELRNFSNLLEKKRVDWNSEVYFIETQKRLASFFQLVLKELKHNQDSLNLKQYRVMDELIYKFPQNEDWILPTRFGNSWAAIESYTIVNFGVALSLLWSRLLAFIPRDYYEIITRTKSRIDASVAGMIFFILFSIIWASLIFQNYPLIVGLFYIFLSLIVFELIYNMGIDSVVSYGKLVKSAVDLYRHEVIKQMGLNAPKDIETERNMWGDLQKLWTSSLNTELKFSRLEEEKSAENT